MSHIPQPFSWFQTLMARPTLWLVYVQKTIYDIGEIYINAGHRGILVAMKSADLDKALPGLVVPVDVALSPSMQQAPVN